MQNFTLRFGKYKGQKIFDTPKSYSDWLYGQNFVANDESYDLLKLGDNVVINYRFFNKSKRITQYLIREGIIVTIKDNYITLNLKQIDTVWLISADNKHYIDNTPIKAKYLKSTIASIEKIPITKINPLNTWLVLDTDNGTLLSDNYGVPILFRRDSDAPHYKMGSSKKVTIFSRLPEHLQKLILSQSEKLTITGGLF